MDVVRAARHSQPTGAPFNLITHCAIRWADFDGVLWEPTEPLDRREELPAGWETPLQRGVFTVESPHRTLLRPVSARIPTQWIRLLAAAAWLVASAIRTVRRHVAEAPE